MKNQYTIYSITNVLNKKQYIGQTRNFENRKSYHFSRPANYMAIGRSIKKYGKDSFKFKIIEQCPDQKITNQCEIYWIKKLNTIIPYGYNIELGGNSVGKHSEATKRKLSKATKLWYKTHKNPMAGRHHSAKSKRKIGLATKVRCSLSTYRRKISMLKMGKPGHRTYGLSKYRGVYKSNSKWGVQIQFRKRHRYLGCFKTQLEASKVYDKKAKELYGKIAILNFPKGGRDEKS